MKSGWTIKKLGEVCELINGKNQSEVTNPSGEYPIYGSGGVIGRADDFRCPASCTIIGRKGSINNPLYVTEPFWNVDTAYALSPAEVEPKFLYYFCLSFDFSKLDCGTTIPSLTSAIVKDVDMPIPPLPEQKRIVAKIDAAFEKVDKLKANAERNLANAKELFQSALDEAMRPKKGWLEKRLGEVGTCKNGLNFKRVVVGKTIDIVGVGDFKKGLFVDDTTSLERLTLDELPEHDWYLQPNDIVFVRSNGSKTLVGRAVIVKTKRPLTFSGFCIRYRIEDGNVNPDFLARIVSAERFRTTMLVGRNASTINNVTQPILLAQAIWFPSLAEQRQIVKRLDVLAGKTKLLEQHYTRQIADCAEMRQSVLREAFEGRL